MKQRARKRRPLRPEEEYVRACLANEIGVPVEGHDDGTTDAMYDLKIRYPDRPPAPVEVSSDVNGPMLGTLNQLAKVANGGSWPSVILSRVWSLHTVSTVAVRTLWPAAEQYLAMLEALHVEQFHVSAVRSGAIAAQFAGVPPTPDVEAQIGLVHLGVVGAQSYLPTDGDDLPGVHVVLEGGGGAWGGTAESVVGWIEAFTKDPARADNLSKLTSAFEMAGEAHLAVIASLHKVDFAVWRAIEDHRGTGVVPAADPTLPFPLTHLWLFASPGGRTGLAWSISDRWRRFTCTPSDRDQHFPYREQCGALTDGYEPAGRRSRSRASTARRTAATDRCVAAAATRSLLCVRARVRPSGSNGAC